MAVDEAAVEALGRVYLAAGTRIRQGLLTATAEGWEWRRCRLLLEQIEAEIARLNLFVGNWETAQLSLAFDGAVAQADDILATEAGAYGLTVPVSDAALWGRLNEGALNAIAAEVAGRRSEFVTSILRQSRDYLKDLATGELAKGLGIGDHPTDVGRAIRDGTIRRLVTGRPLQSLTEGIDRACGVVYSDGSVHSLHAYGQMSARTGMLGAFNEASALRYRSAGVHLVKVSTHNTLCHLCHPLEGTAWSLDDEGERLGYPRPNFSLPRHPGCRHSWIPVIPGAPITYERIDQEVERMSNRQLYRRMRDQVPDGEERLRAGRRGFRTWTEYQRLKAGGAEYGPRYREPGIESRRIEATRRAIASGGRLTYAQAMGQVSGERMRDEQRGIFAPAAG